MNASACEATHEKSQNDIKYGYSNITVAEATLINISCSYFVAGGKKIDEQLEYMYNVD